MRAVDCQSFAGGFALGVVQAGFELAGKREVTGGFGVAAMEANRHLLGYRWLAQDSAPEDWEPVKAELVFGNPPCSGYSVQSAGVSEKAGRAFGPEFQAKMNACQVNFVNYAAECDPEVVIFECVPGAFTRGREAMQRLHARLEFLTGHQYTLHHVLHNVMHLGGAQNRARYFFVASRVPFAVDTAKIPGETVSERLGGIPDDAEGHFILDCPRTRLLAELAATTEWNPGEKSCIPHARNPSVPIYKPDQSMSGFCSTRLRGDKPGRVVAGDALMTTVHPTEDRTITYREIARLMGLPDTWTTAPYRHPKSRSFWFGKGICVEPGRWIAEAAANAIEGNPVGTPGEQIGDREYLIDANHKERAHAG